MSVQRIEEEVEHQLAPTRSFEATKCISNDRRSEGSDRRTEAAKNGGESGAAVPLRLDTIFASQPSRYSRRATSSEQRGRSEKEGRVRFTIPARRRVRELPRGHRTSRRDLLPTDNLRDPYRQLRSRHRGARDEVLSQWLR